MAGKNKQTYLGVELGSTRIKAVAIDQAHAPVSSGDYTWASTFENGVWTYSIDEVWAGLKAALAGVEERENIGVMAVSAMMHGYLAFDSEWNLLVPFRTWQNTITGQAAAELTELFGFNVPQRWSVAHLYQAILNGEEHIAKLAHITTLAGYVHYMLTGVNAIGVGEASGMFPIDSEALCYDKAMLAKFDALLAQKGVDKKAEELLPGVLCAGESAGCLTEEGAQLLGGLLPAGIPLAPAEGDAGTGMTATNAVAPRTGNVSAGTSIFSMVVLEKPLSKVYEEIDMVTTPTGKPVAMVHCNNCTNDSNAWVGVLRETAALFGAQPSTGELYTKLYEKSLEGDADCGGVLVCNYMAGEGITHMDSGRPMVVRLPDAKFTLPNFFRAQLYSTMSTLKLGMDILAGEHVAIDSLTGHGGLFKTPVVGQKYLAAACNAPVTCMETAGEGGPYGSALLAAYMANKAEGETLEAYLNAHVFAGVKGTTLAPEQADVDGFNAYIARYSQLLKVEQTAIEAL
ncbi:MAG: FGGY-family carbohydrate kinase [Eubacteriales bacterium]|nr:FGGY-family carbohydrate kinase [Eubacteriales bacterium]